ncbi:hypothetical protein P152DRAFT_189450 [Eremomyces bilateralis CBS 781.70]|uniref:Uncharacterized protein n=1 Tax=Eremomyces bilateralis CBS 781.70 TaxID=1392243 RepID=A0A6G1GBV7_9PEZI|nr:uncharacterized protein P152DRAFT_189450 [Eremomyces bilateralis CBS 781.70]KAF1815575.1 hypothetical protein P152DRAFT_189450 [Eremomyces bilateralis CBS 781.70]
MFDCFFGALGASGANFLQATCRSLSITRCFLLTLVHLPDRNRSLLVLAPCFSLWRRRECNYARHFCTPAPSCIRSSPSTPGAGFWSCDCVMFEIVRKSLEVAVVRMPGISFAVSGDPKGYPWVSQLPQVPIPSANLA